MRLAAMRAVRFCSAISLLLRKNVDKSGLSDQIVEPLDPEPSGATPRGERNAVPVLSPTRNGS